MVAIAKSFKVRRNDIESIHMASYSPIVILDMKDIMSLQKHCGSQSAMALKWLSNMTCMRTMTLVNYDSDIIVVIVDNISSVV